MSNVSTISNKDLIASIVDKVVSLDTATSSFAVTATVGVCLFVALTSFYIWRARTFSEMKSEDLGGFVLAIIYLLQWNLQFVLQHRTLLFDSGWVKRSLLVILEQFKNSLDVSVKAIAGDEEVPPLDQMHTMYDLSILLHCIVLSSFFKIFSMSVLRMCEYICFTSYGYPNKDDSKETMPGIKPTKSVSFKEEIETLEYLDFNASIKKSKIARIPKYMYSKIIRYSSILLVAFVISIWVTPTKYLCNTSTVIYSNPGANILVNFDHVFLSVGVLFLITNIQSFISVLNHPEISNFPKFLSTIACFAWCYNGIVILFFFFALKLINDILLNMLFNIIEEATNTTMVNENRMHLVTLMFVSFFRHSCDMKCYHLVCSTEESIDGMVENFIFIKNILFKSALMVNYSCLVIMPMVIWIIIIECKLRRHCHDSGEAKVLSDNSRPLTYLLLR